MTSIESGDSPEYQDGLVRRVLAALRKEYVIVGRRRVRSWHAWLAIGIAAGIAVAIIVVSQSSGVEPSGAARRAPAARSQAKKFSPLPRNNSPFRYRSASPGREQAFTGGVLRSIGQNALQVDAIAYDATISGWRAKSMAVSYASVKKFYVLELQTGGFVKRREIKRNELVPGMKIGIARIGNRVDVTVLPAVPIATP